MWQNRQRYWLCPQVSHLGSGLCCCWSTPIMTVQMGDLCLSPLSVALSNTYLKKIKIMGPALCLKAQSIMPASHLGTSSCPRHYTTDHLPAHGRGNTIENGPRMRLWRSSQLLAPIWYNPEVQSFSLKSIFK